MSALLFLLCGPIPLQRKGRDGEACKGQLALRDKSHRQWLSVGEDRGRRLECDG